MSTWAFEVKFVSTNSFTLTRYLCTSEQFGNLQNILLLAGYLGRFSDLVLPGYLGTCVGCRISPITLTFSNHLNHQRMKGTAVLFPFQQAMRVTFLGRVSLVDILVILIIPQQSRPVFPNLGEMFPWGEIFAFQGNKNSSY